MSKKNTIILSPYNNKGGVAKSSYSGLLSLFLSSNIEIKNKETEEVTFKHEAKKVLIIDGDPQSNTTSRLYAFQHDNATLGDLLLNTDTMKMSDGIIKGFLEDYPNLDIIPANRKMRYLEEVLLSIDATQERDLVIAKWMAENIDTVSEYDYIIWDISPSTSILGRNILNTCNKLLFVSEYNNIDSFEAIAKFVEEFQEYKESNGFGMPEFAILINKYKKSDDAVKLYEPFQDCFENLQQHILDTKMIESSVIRMSNIHKKNIVDYTLDNKLNKKAMNLFLDIIKELQGRGIINE